MYTSISMELGQIGAAPPQEEQRLRQLLKDGLEIHTEVDGQKLHIYLPPSAAKDPYYPERRPESRAYWALPQDERTKVTATVDQIFRQFTGVARKLNPKDPKDKPWIRSWLRLRDFMMTHRTKNATAAPLVWFTNPLPPSALPRFEKAIKDLELKVATTPDPHKQRYLCWIEKLKQPDVDDRVIRWSKICPRIFRPLIIKPCDISQGIWPVDQSALQQSIRSANDVSIANKSLQFITYMRSDIVVSFELTLLPLENLRNVTIDVGFAIDNLANWANIGVGGSSAMPTSYRAIKDWIMYQQRNSRSLYSCR